MEVVSRESWHQETGPIQVFVSGQNTREGGRSGVSFLKESQSWSTRSRFSFPKSSLPPRTNPDLGSRRTVYEQTENPFGAQI